jgi:methionyl-tRNA formyltransferase
MLSRPANSPHPIVVLTAGGVLSRIVVNGLADRLGHLTVIEEQQETKAEIIRRRARLLGWPQTLSQVAAGILIRMLAGRRNARIGEIVRAHNLDTSVRPGITVHRVASINSPEARQLLTGLAPSAVAVYGTRILKAATLKSVAAPIINYHAGINPKYRGQHPGYWALVNNDPENAGVTIHLVDEGVDTGSVLYQARCAFDTADTISSYQYVQAARALPLFAQAVEDALNDRLQPRQVALPSRQWFPPTLGRYLATGLVRGVW